MTRKLTLPDITRIEVIDGSGRAFVRRYDTAGASVHVQDEGRTVKVFAAETQTADTAQHKPPFTALRDAVNDSLNAAHEFLGEPATAGAALDAVIDRVRGAFATDDAPEPAKAHRPGTFPTREALLEAVSDALIMTPALLDNPEYGGSAADVIVDHLFTLFAPNEA